KPKKYVLNRVPSLFEIGNSCQCTNKTYGVIDKVWCDNIIPLCIGMQTGQIEIDTEIGHKYGIKSQYAHKGEQPFFVQLGNQTHVNDKGIDQNTNQGPGFLWVPSPISSPTLIGPLASQKIPNGQHDQTDRQCNFRKQYQFKDYFPKIIVIFPIQKGHG